MSDSDIIDRLIGAVDPDQAVPMYHQLAAVVRWEIATGRLPIGTMLPPIRAIARAVGVNYHTVRRGWTALANEGVLSLRRGRGARVVRVPADPAGWSPAPGRKDRGGQPRVWVVLASLERAARLATRIAQRWQVTAVPYPLDGPVPPPGPLISTGPLPDDWGRESDLQPVELVLEPATVGAIRQAAEVLTLKRVALVAAPDDEGHPLTELLRQLPRLGLSTDRALAPDLGGQQLNACFPVAHDRLDWATRSDPRVIGIELDWAPGPLARVATRLGWERRDG